MILETVGPVVASLGCCSYEVWNKCLFICAGSTVQFVFSSTGLFPCELCGIHAQSGLSFDPHQQCKLSYCNSPRIHLPSSEIKKSVERHPFTCTPSVLIACIQSDSIAMMSLPFQHCHLRCITPVCAVVHSASAFVQPHCESPHVCHTAYHHFL